MAEPIVGVHHVNVIVHDLAAARAFYADVLGLTEIDRPAFGFSGAWFQLGAHQLHLVEQEGHVAPDRQHFAVEVADLDRAVAAIEAAGWQVRRSPGTAGAGSQAFLRDPSRNLIELNQPR